MNNNSKQILFIDKITLFSLAKLAFFGRSFRQILYFDPILPRLQKIIGIAGKIGIITGNVRQISHHIGQVKNDQGESGYVRLAEFARDITAKILAEAILRDPLLYNMEALWKVDKVQFYFERLIEQEITRECLRIGLVDWLLRKETIDDLNSCTLMIKKGPWHAYLVDHAKVHDIRLVGYRDYGSGIVSGLFSGLRLYFGRILPTSGGIIKKIRQRLTNARRRVVNAKSHLGIPAPASRIAIRYGHRKLSISDTERNEFFWLTGTDIPHSEILLYDYVGKEPIDPQILKALKEKGIAVIGRGPHIPPWHSGLVMYGTAVRVSILLCTAVLRRLLRDGRVSFFIVEKLFKLTFEFAYWYDFFKTNRVKINIATSFNTTVAQVLALARLQGVSMAYQHSISNLVAPVALMSAGENVQFCFSLLFEKMWRSVNAPVDHYVHTGFIYDGAIKAVCKSKRGLEVRQQLHANGARYVICFFDENSVNRWDILNSDDDAVRDYRYLADWLISDPQLGIVFKPKNSLNLFRRLNSIADLLEKARQTGRCVFLTSDTLCGDIYPAEAAMSADLCIGKLLGATVSLETSLTGKPTLLLDSEGFCAHPFHAWGRDRIIFNEWDALRNAIEQYRISPNSYPLLGNWSPGIDNLDPFRDGQAGRRMNSYVSWTYAALKKGGTRQEALAEANSKYAAEWAEK